VVFAKHGQHGHARTGEDLCPIAEHGAIAIAKLDIEGRQLHAVLEEALIAFDALDLAAKPGHLPFDGQDFVHAEPAAIEQRPHPFQGHAQIAERQLVVEQGPRHVGALDVLGGDLAALTDPRRRRGHLAWRDPEPERSPPRTGRTGDLLARDHAAPGGHLPSQSCDHRFGVVHLHGHGAGDDDALLGHRARWRLVPDARRSCLLR